MMKILVCSNRDFVSNLALNQLWPALGTHDVELVLSSGHGRKGTLKPRQIEDWETYEQEFLKQGVGSGSCCFRAFEQLAGSCASGIPGSFTSLNDGDGLKYVEAFSPDVIISIRFGQIFKTSVLSVPGRGVLNLHSGILPDYRGILATFWAMLHDDKAIGATLHFVPDGTIDTGPIVAIARLPTRWDRSLFWNIAQLYEAGTALIKRALTLLDSGRPIECSPQDPSRARYFSYPGPDEVARFIQKGGSLYSPRDYEEITAALR